MILVSLVILLISPTITKKTDNAQVTNQAAKFSQPKVSRVMVVEMVAKADDRAERLARFFASKNSPFTAYAADFVEIADKYGFDYTLLPAITGVESSFGLSVPKGTFNPYGWNNGVTRFSSWKDANEQVAAGIRTRYAPFGAVNPFAIGHRYASDPFWANKVYRNQLEISRF